MLQAIIPIHTCTNSSNAGIPIIPREDGVLINYSAVLQRSGAQKRYIVYIQALLHVALQQPRLSPRTLLPTTIYYTLYILCPSLSLSILYTGEPTAPTNGLHLLLRAFSPAESSSTLLEAARTQYLTAPLPGHCSLSLSHTPARARCVSPL